MPINTDLNISPYYDDYDIENQFYKVLFKPAYAVQARELTQLQTILQNQIEQFGDNIFKEGSIIKGSTFTNLNDLKYVKLNNKTGFDPELYKPVTVVEDISGVDTEVDIIYSKAKKENNSSQIIKSLLYKSKFALTLEEDAQLLIIKNLKQEISKSSFPNFSISFPIIGLSASLYWSAIVNGILLVTKWTISLYSVALNKISSSYVNK